MSELSAPQVVVGMAVCRGEGCSKRANYNFPGKPPWYCKAHSQRGMVRCTAGCFSFFCHCFGTLPWNISVPVDVHRRMLSAGCVPRRAASAILPSTFIARPRPSSANFTRGRAWCGLTAYPSVLDHTILPRLVYRLVTCQQLLGVPAAAQENIFAGNSWPIGVI